MQATIPYVKARFQEFNQLIFHGQLPDIPIQLSRSRKSLGMLHYKKKRNWLGNVKLYDFCIKISALWDLSEKELEDTIIHEMIHYHIAVNGIRDTSTHGTVFRQMMQDINRKYGRNITITHRSTPEEREQMSDRRPRMRYIAIVTFKDGRKGIKVLPNNSDSASRYYHRLKDAPTISSICMYQSNDPFFNQFPCSSAFNVVFARNMDEVLQHLGIKPVI